MTKKIIIELADDGTTSSEVQLEKASRSDIALILLEIELLKLQLMQIGTKDRKRDYI
jgi:hypothetical protein